MSCRPGAYENVDSMAARPEHDYLGLRRVHSATFSEEFEWRFFAKFDEELDERHLARNQRGKFPCAHSSFLSKT